MKQELDEQLCKKFPKIFADRHKPMSQTAMCWGFAHGDGWFNIINALCYNIQAHIDSVNSRRELLLKDNPYNVEIPKPVPQVVASQVKEKFGTLSFYYNGGDDQIWGMVRMAEAMSGVTCEVCGAPGTRGGSGWISTLCETHRKEREAV